MRAFIALVAALSVPAMSAAADDPRGRQLAQSVYDRPDGKDATSQGLMILTEQGHAPRIRQMNIYRLERGASESWSLIRFNSPADIAGTGMLTLDYAGEESDQWLFLPALDRSRRIPSNRMGGQFVGSDLAYEDLRDREVSSDHHRHLGAGSFQGAECELLESIPVRADNSIYGKRVSCIHPKTFIPLSIDYYVAGKDQPVKRFTVQRIEKIQGYWTVMESTMADLQSNHSTRIKVEQISYDRDLPQELFSRQTLEDPARETPYRP